MSNDSVEERLLRCRALVNVVGYRTAPCRGAQQPRQTLEFQEGRVLW